MSAGLNTGAIMVNSSASNSRPQSNDPTSLRSKIVEILAGTANGCLTELGYYPGMPQKLQALELQNAQWQSENVKLFQDNRSLARALQQHNDRSKHMNSIRTLENKVTGLLNERAQLLQRNEALMTGRPSEPSYQQLLSEHHKLQDYYTAALTEIKQLREFIERIGGGQQSQPHPTQVSIGQQLRAPLFVGQGPQPSLSPQVHEIPRVSHIAHSRTPVNPIVPSQQPANPSTQANQASVTHDQTKLASNLQKTLSIVSSWRRHNDVHLPERPSSSRSSSSISSRTHPAPQPTTSAARTINFQYQPAPSIGIAHAPLTHQTYSLPPTPLSPINTSLPHFPIVTPPQASNPQLSELVIAPETTSQVPGDSQHSPSRKSASPAEPTVLTTTHNVTSDSDAAVSTPKQSPASEHDSLKRASVAISEEDEVEHRKRQRLEDQSRGFSTEEEAKSDQGIVASHVDDEEESDDDEAIEVGPDGLRLVEDCLGALIEDDEKHEGVQSCKLCLARFNLGYSEMPKPFVNASTDELLQHCATEHQNAWDALRRKV